MNRSRERAFLRLDFAVALACAGIGSLTAPTSAASGSIVYADIGAGLTAYAAPGETVRFYVGSDGCRYPALDEAPAVTGVDIDFTLGFYGCGVEPPTFNWISDLANLGPGHYTVHYRSRGYVGNNLPPSPPVEVATTSLVVASRAPADTLARGAIDPSFGHAGFAEIPFPGFFYAPTRLVTQRQGHAIVSSMAYGNRALARIQDAGTLDAGFGMDGSLDFPNSALVTPALARGADDSLFLAGYRFDPVAFRYLLAVRRYTSDGVLRDELDYEALGSLSSVPDQSEIRDIIAFADGSFVVAGTLGPLSAVPPCAPQWFVAKFTAAGALDQSFGTQGLFLSASGGCVHRLAATTDGGLLVLGSTAPADDADFLTRLDASGRVQAAFGQSGTIVRGFARVAPRVLADGRFLIGGAGFSLMRFNADGTPDASFGSNGIVANATGLALRLEDFVMTHAGSVILVGALAVGSGAPGDPTVQHLQPVLVSYQSDGTLDPGFGANGLTFVDATAHAPGDDATELMALTMLGDGGALLATPSASGGWWNRAVRVYRFQADPAASGGGSAAVDVPALGATMLALMVGAILLAGLVTMRSRRD